MINENLKKIIEQKAQLLKQLEEINELVMEYVTEKLNARQALIARIDKIKEHLVPITEELSQVETAIDSFLDESGLDRIQHKEVTVTRKPDMATKIIDWDQVYAWIEQNKSRKFMSKEGEELELESRALIKKDINSKTFKKLYEIGVIPDGIEVNTYNKTSYYKKNVKRGKTNDGE